MIIVRTVMQGHFGKGGDLAAHMAQTNRQIAEAMAAHMGGPRRWRVMSDLIGGFDRVVFEVELENLAEWEQSRSVLFGLPAFQESMARGAELIASGQNELWKIEAEG